jgi:hypothetical protein
MVLPLGDNGAFAPAAELPVYPGNPPVVPDGDRAPPPALVPSPVRLLAEVWWWRPEGGGAKR